MDRSKQPGWEALTAAANPRPQPLPRDLNPGPVRPRRKIFFLLDSLAVGGTETQAVELASRLDPERYDVTLGCIRARGPLLAKLAGTAVSVREFYPRGGVDSARGVYQMLRLAMFLGWGGFEIVHTHDLYSNLLGIPAAVLARVPVILSSRRDLAHFDWYQSGRRVWLRRLQNLSDAVLTNARAIREALIAEDRFAAEKVRVIYNGVDVERFGRESRSRDWLVPGGGQEKWVVLVGNMHSDVKGHPALIAAAVHVVRDFPETRFVLIGEGGQRKDFERQVNQLGLERHFSFLGHRDDVADILACCDLAVLPSRFEGLPNAVLEYLAAGLPSIVSSVGGNAEIVEDGKTGLLVPPEDSSALAEALLRLLRQPDWAASLGKNGREYVASHFSFPRMMAATEELYEELLRARGGERHARLTRSKDLYRRVLAMDRAEIADRLRQAVSARMDLVRYRAGADFVPGVGEPAASSAARFFFAPEAVAGLCERLRQLFPGTAEQIIERAERICQHRFDLLGYRDVDYGAEIDWHCDRVHGKRAPRKPWFQVKYLDFAEVGDSKIIWELNRHQHLVTLAKAFRLTGEEKFAAELFRQWNHWHRENPYPIGINWASSLEVAFRSLSWFWVYWLLADSPVLPRGFRSAWLRSQAISGRHIDGYLSTYFSPNTHLLGEAVALVFLGTLCPELPLARRWQQRGWALVEQEAVRQVRDDGLHFEQSLYYHVYALDLFLHAAVLASVNQITVQVPLQRTLERMLEALAAVARNGRVPQLGDDDGGRVFDPARNRAMHLLDPLATGAVLFGRGDFKMLAVRPREETLWLLGEAGIEEFDRLAEVPPARNSVAFPASGLYVMRGDDPAQQLVIDAGPQGAHNAGHGHADALSVTANSASCDILIDSGTLEYVGPEAERDRFRGTRAHNTLVVAGKDQADPRGPFSWGRLPRVEAEGWIMGKTFDLFVGSHDGYSRLPNGVVHRRFVFSLKSGFWLVRDQAFGFGEYELDLFWHLGPGLRASADQENLFLGSGHGVRFVTVEGHGWTREVEERPHAPVYGKKESHSVLHFASRRRLPAEFLTLLSPVEDAPGSRPKLTKLRAFSSQPSAVAGYRYQTARDEHCMFFGEGKPWKLDRWTSDAEFLYCGRRPEASAQTLIACKATYVRWAGRTIVTAERAFLRCEIIGGRSQCDVVSPDLERLTVEREGWRMLVANGSPQLAGDLNSEQP
ncbi:MAG TPA: heparinase II/III family protein [Terriglobales bacterium]|nr:heparinase II/III family protein [Terriglobales bacterium]